VRKRGRARVANVVSGAKAAADEMLNDLPDIPPWIWIWTATFMVQLPGEFGKAWFFTSGTLVNTLIPSTLPPGTLPPTWHNAVIIIPPVLIILLPHVSLGLGIAMTALPWLRGRWVERRHRLSPLAAVQRARPTHVEILAFIARIAPDTAVRAYFANSSRIAFAYPLGYRCSAIGIFGGLTRLWHRDRAVAEAVLLHEAAHVLHRDVLVLGSGSALKAVAERWIWIALLLVVMPVTVGAGALSLANSSGSPQQADAFEGLRLLVVYGGSIIAFVVACAFFYTGAVFAPLIAAIWAAELSADRSAAARHTGGAQALLRLLEEEQRQVKGSLWHSLGSGFSHPPSRLRCWLLRRSDQRCALAVALLIFPLGYTASPVLLAAAMSMLNMAAYILSGPVAPPRAIAAGFILGLERIAALELLATGIALTVWPIIARRSAAGRTPALYLALGAPLVALGLWNRLTS
jgi:Zn-dependent protease with chaperone function